MSKSRTGLVFETCHWLMHAIRQVPESGPALRSCKYERVIPAKAGIQASILVMLTLFLFPSCANKKEEFPNQIDDVKSSLGVFQNAISGRNRALLDSVSTDAQLYDELTYVLGADSLAILSRRIQNPIDSAHVIMTVGPKRPDDTAVVTYNLELFMRKRGDTYWIVAHRLSRSPQ